jgi:hypothetical protein
VALARNQARAVDEFVFGTEGYVTHTKTVYTKIV